MSRKRVSVDKLMADGNQTSLHRVNDILMGSNIITHLFMFYVNCDGQ